MTGPEDVQRDGQTLQSQQEQSSQNLPGSQQQASQTSSRRTRSLVQVKAGGALPAIQDRRSRSREPKREEHSNSNTALMTQAPSPMLPAAASLRKASQVDFDNSQAEAIRESQSQMKPMDVDAQERPLGGQVVSLVDGEFKSLDDGTKRGIQKATKQLISRIQTLQKLKVRIAEYESRLEVLKKDRLPEGVKPMTFPYETPLLDSPLSKKNETFTVEFQAGMSVREAMAKLHLSQTKWRTERDLEIAQAQRLELKKSTRPTEFIQECVSAVSGMTEAMIDLDLDLEGFHIEHKTISEECARKKAGALFKSVVEKAAKEVAEKKQAKQRSSQKQEDVVNEMLKKTPADFFRNAVSEVVSEVLEKGKSRGKGKLKSQSDGKRSEVKIDNVGALLENEKSAKSLANFVSPKNDEPRQSKPSSGTKGQSKGKGKGKGKSKSKAAQTSTSRGRGRGRSRGRGRGRGSAHPVNTKGKGKGKSKSKSKTNPSQGDKGRGRGSTRGRGRGGRFQ